MQILGEFFGISRWPLLLVGEVLGGAFKPSRAQFIGFKIAIELGLLRVDGFLNG